MKTYEWHLEDYLDTPEMVIEYLNQVIEEGDQDELVRAIGYLSRAKGMTTIARKAGVSRETLYTSFNTGGNPTFSTLRSVLASCGIELRFVIPHNDEAGADASFTVSRSSDCGWDISLGNVRQLAEVV